MTTTETGIITEVRNVKASVLLGNVESCGILHGGCGDKADHKKDMIVHVPLNQETDETVKNIQPVDYITLECETGNPAKMSFLYLMLPLILAVTGSYSR